MKEARAYSVSELSSLIKDSLDENPLLNSVLLRGEISNFRLYPSGHAYFSLKDSQAIISGVMWASHVSHLTFRPKDGDEVLAHGQVSAYPAQGKYQIYVDEMELFGQGAALLKLKELAKKLQAEGLFDESRKRPLPRFPQKIGIISAKGSAAIRDMEVNLLKRWPLIQIVAFPSLVQGPEAPKSLLASFALAQQEDLDVLIIGRGGGSSEDLGAFNDEKLVRALATSRCPTISAVGHEVDFTLTDYVCDKRVSTPTGAAVAAVPDQNEILQNLDGAENFLRTALKTRLESLRQELDSLKKRGYFANPAEIYERKLQDLENTKERFLLDISTQEKQRSQAVESTKMRLKALSPYGVLGRGYSIATDEKGQIFSSVKQVKPGTVLKNQLKDGIIVSTVNQQEEKGNAQ